MLKQWWFSASRRFDTMPHQPYRLLFVCTGNSCRSQMAEGWARYLGGQLVDVRSAGLEAHGINPRTIRVMGEAGVDISGQQSTRLTPEMLTWADMVITVCAHADEHCPIVPPGVLRQHWGLTDPAKATGSDATVMQVFRATRDEIRERVTALMRTLHSNVRVLAAS